MPGKSRLSAEHILKFVNLIHDSKLGSRFEDRFSAVMAEINGVIPIHRGLCILLDKRSIQVPSGSGGVKILYDEDILKDRRVIQGEYSGTDDYGRYYSQFDPTAKLVFGNINSAARFSDCDPKDPGGQLFRNDFMKQNDFEFGMGSCFEFGGNELLIMSLLRDERSTDFSDQEKTLFELLGPVLARSAKNVIQAELVQKARSNQRDGSEPGLVLASMDGELEFCDADALSLLERVGGGLNPAELIRAAAGYMTEQGRPEHYLRLPILSPGPVQWLEIKCSQVDRRRLAVTVRKLAGGSQQRFDAAANYAGLTKRERDVAALVTQGLINKEIARELGISMETVKEYLSKACRKCSVKGRTALVSYLLG